MIKIKRTLDISKVLKCHVEIVHDESRFFGSTLRSVFLGSDLVDWLLKNYNPTNTSREGITKLVNEELFDPTLPHQLIYPATDEAQFVDSKKHFYRFIDDQFVEFKKDYHIINLHGLDTSLYQFFYEQDGSISVFKVIEELKEVLQNIYQDFVEENGTRVNYEELVDSDVFNARYIPLATKLAYIDLTSIIANDNQLKAFFINVYNIFAIHILVNKYLAKKTLNINVLERMDYLNTYKYNIGGHNYTLNDIQHGILRKNDASGANIGTIVLQFAFKLTSKLPRFKETDPRFKFVVRQFDQRIHFALNYGVISCPALKYYASEEIDKQLDESTRAFINSDARLMEYKSKKCVLVSQLFKYYYWDFGKNDAEVLKNLVKNMEDGIEKEKIEKAMQREGGVPLAFKTFDLQTNVKGVQKATEEVEDVKDAPKAEEDVKNISNATEDVKKPEEQKNVENEQK